MDQAALNAITQKAKDAAFRVHMELGPGLLETAYTSCLLHELQLAGLRVQMEVPVPVVYKGTKLLDVGYRLDILVEGEVVIEVKAVEALAPVHFAQLVSYLKLADKRVGLLIHFNVERLKDGIFAGFISFSLHWQRALTQRAQRKAKTAEDAKGFSVSSAGALFAGGAGYAPGWRRRAAADQRSGAWPWKSPVLRLRRR